MKEDRSGTSQQHESWKDSLLLGLLILFPFAFAFDFKGATGGTWAQFIMATYAVFVFLCLLFAGPLRPTRPARLAIILTAAFFFLGCFMAGLNSVPFDRAIRIIFLFWLFLSGLWVGCAAANSAALGRTLFHAMVGAGLCSLFFRYYYATDVAGVGLHEMRYQVLSPAISCLIAYICASFCFMRKISVPVLFTAIATTVIIALSVTRSYIIAAVFMVMGVPIIVFRLSWNNSRHDAFRLWRKIGLWFVSCGLVAGLLFAAFLRPDLLEVWAGRMYSQRALTVSGVDVNYITRVAEASGIWKEVSSGKESLLFGMGFGNSYQWDYDYVGEVGSVSQDMVYAFFAPTWEPAHSAFSYALFFGGVPALLWQIWMFAMPLVSGWRVIPLMRRCTDWKLLQLFLFNMLVVWMYLSQSITSNPWGERLSAQFLGLSMGMLLAFSKLFIQPELRRAAMHTSANGGQIQRLAANRQR